MYTKHFRQQTNATVCRVKYHSEQRHCVSGDDSGMDAHHAGIPIDLTVTASQCKIPANGRSNLFKRWNTRVHEGNQNNGSETKDFDDDGVNLSDKYKIELDSFGQVNHKTFEGHVQDVTLRVRTKDGKVMSKNGLQLPCHLEELGCDSISIEPYSYTWETQANCLLAVHGKEDVNLIKQGKTTIILSVDAVTPANICSK